MITSGDVAMVWFPFSHQENEPYKERPVLVLAVHGNHPDQAVLVAMITGNPARFLKPGPGDVPLSNWADYGLLKPSVIRTRRIWTAEGRDFTGKTRGQVDPEIVEAAKTELRVLLA